MRTSFGVAITPAWSVSFTAGDGSRITELAERFAGAPAWTHPLAPAVDRFPGRWNPRRAIPDEVAPLPAACAAALERARVWRSGGGESCAGGLVVATEGIHERALARFARELASDPAAVGASGFLWALPSTAASVIGLLFGLSDYQATVTEGDRGASSAFLHALDLLALGRLRRVLVAAVGSAEHTLAPGLRPQDNPALGAVHVAAAIYLDAMDAATMSSRGERWPRRATIDVGCEIAAAAQPAGRFPAAVSSFALLPPLARDLGAASFAALAARIAAAPSGATIEIPRSGDRRSGVRIRIEAEESGCPPATN